MLDRLFLLGKKKKKRHSVKSSKEVESSQNKSEIINDKYKNTSKSSSEMELMTDLLDDNSTIKHVEGSNAQEILKDAEENKANNKQDKSRTILPPEEKSNQDFTLLDIKDNKQSESIDPAIKDIICKLYPNKYKDGLSYDAFEVSQTPTLRDEYFEVAGRYLIEKNKPSITLLQRIFKIGFNRAARIMEQLEEAGVVSKETSTRARTILMTMPEFESYLEKDTENYIIESYGSDRYNSDRYKYETYKNFRWHDTFYFSYDDYRKAKKLLDDESERILVEDYQIPKYMIYRSFSVIENLKSHKNSIITNSQFSTPTSFVLATMEKCSPAKLQLILIDDKSYFSKFRDYYLLYHSWLREDHLLEILEWCIEERDRRQKSTLYSTHFEYEPAVFSNELPIIIIVRELYNILQISGVRDKLLQLMVNSYKFGIFFIGFSQYDSYNLGINSFRTMAELFSDEEVFEILADEKADRMIELLGQSHRMMEPNSHRELVDIDTMDGIDFEKYCANVLKKNRFTNIKVTKSSGDYGADIIAVKDHIKYAIQCKRSVTPIGNKAVQEVIASRSVYNCHVGVVLTNNFFTNSAKILAEKNIILLWDRNELLKMSTPVNK